MAKIEPARKEGFVDHLHAYHVLLDGDQIGEVRCSPRSLPTVFYGITFGRREYIKLEVV